MCHILIKRPWLKQQRGCCLLQFCSHSNSDHALALTCSPYMALKCLCGWQQLRWELLKKTLWQFSNLLLEIQQGFHLTEVLTPLRNDSVVPGRLASSVHLCGRHSPVSNRFAVWSFLCANCERLWNAHLLRFVIHGAVLWLRARDTQCHHVEVTDVMLTLSTIPTASWSEWSRLKLILTRSLAVFSDDGWREWVGLSNFQLQIDIT